MSTLTAATFRTDYPEFTSTANLPDTAVTNYIAQGALQLNPQRWGGQYINGLELYVAHHAALYIRRQQTAALGGVPGLAKGNIASESPGQVSLSYDTQVGSEQGAGFYNSTEYGIEFIHLARLFGMTPLQIGTGGGEAPGVIHSYMAWPGPPTGNGYSF